jgi:hypothetical protein
MRSKRSFLRFLGMGGLVFMGMGALSVHAHRGHHGLSHLLIAKDGRLRLTHYFSAQDIEPELVTLSPNSQPSLDDLDSMQSLIKHLETGLLINNQGLKLVDKELVDDRALFILEGKLRVGTSSLKLDLNLFPYSDHFHSLNMTIENGGKKRGFRILRGQTLGPIDLTRF